MRGPQEEQWVSLPNTIEISALDSEHLRPPVDALQLLLHSIVNSSRHLPPRTAPSQPAARSRRVVATQRPGRVGRNRCQNGIPTCGSAPQPGFGLRAMPPCPLGSRRHHSEAWAGWTNNLDKQSGQTIRYHYHCTNNLGG